MAPRPIEDIDFPDLGEKILELFYALWIFICDICIIVWSFISQAFWAAWMYPPFETFRNEFSAALVALWDYVVVHPVTSTVIFVLAFILVPAALNVLRVCLLRSLGCREQVPLRSNYVHYQSTRYGGNVPRRSALSRAQSRGGKSGGGHCTTGCSGGSPSWA